MTTRLLPPEEWARLAETEGGEVWRLFDQESTKILVVERDGRIIGRLAVLTIQHADFFWIDSVSRDKTSVCWQLWFGLKNLIRSAPYGGVIVSILSDRMRRFVTKAGAVPMPGEHFTWDLNQRTEHRQPLW